MTSNDGLVESIFGVLGKKFSDRLIFAGVVDPKAKLIHFQKGAYTLFLPIDRQNALDVQLSLVCSLSQQLEDIGGKLDHTVLTFKDCEIVILQVSSGSVLYVICSRGSAAAISHALLKLVNDIARFAGDDDYIEHEWSGR